MQLKQIQENPISHDKGLRVLFVMGVLFIAFNLRPAITSVGPLIGMIRDDVGFQNWSVALLTSLPLIAFAIMSPMAPKLANYTTNEWALFIGLSLLVIGIGIRSISIIFFLFTGTLLIGLGIAVCNVLLPGIIKEKFPQKVAIMTSLYTTGMATFATTASGVSIPLANGLELGWQLSLLFWIIPAVIGGIIWLLIAVRVKRPQQEETHTENKGSSNIWKSALAWQVALFMGLQSLIFYVTISWLTEILIDFGISQTAAGFFLSYFQLLGIPVSFMMPLFATRLKSQSTLVIIINLAYITGILLLLWNHSMFNIFISVGLIGIASSSNFALALTFLSIRAKDGKDASALSGMAQSMGYILAAIGPILIGSIFDFTHGWTIPLVCLIIVAVMIMFFGTKAGRNQYVLE